MRISRAHTVTCLGCGKTIPWWWFKLGDRSGWWHVLCMIRDELGDTRAQ